MTVDARSRKFDIVIVDDFALSSRDGRELCEVNKMLQIYDIEIHDCDGCRLVSGPMFLVAGLSAMSNRRAMRERFAAGRAAARVKRT
jgi:DNA invertase Pin-like site-specific DNA recombinase